MKKVSVRLNAHQAKWLKTQADIQGLSCSEYVRDLIRERIKEPHFFEYFKTVEAKRGIAVPETKHLIYSLMTYKLVEQLVLNSEAGKEKREAAYAETLEWLEKLKVQPGKERFYKLSVLLYPEQLAWLNQQAEILEKNMTTIVRKIVFLAFVKGAETASNAQLTTLQKEELKAVLATFKLLETYVESAYEAGEILVKSCYESAEALYKKLYLNQL